MLAVMDCFFYSNFKKFQNMYVSSAQSFIVDSKLVKNYDRLKSYQVKILHRVGQLKLSSNHQESQLHGNIFFMMHEAQLDNFVCQSAALTAYRVSDGKMTNYLHWADFLGYFSQFRGVSIAPGCTICVTITSLLRVLTI